MAKTKIEMDLDILGNAISQYDDIILNFQQSVADTEKAIQALKTSGWKSDASTAYFLKYDDTWKKNMEKKIAIMKHLRSCLKKAKKEYTAVYEEMQDLDSVL